MWNSARKWRGKLVWLACPARPSSERAARASSVCILQSGTKRSTLRSTACRISAICCKYCHGRRIRTSYSAAMLYLYGWIILYSLSFSRSATLVGMSEKSVVLSYQRSKRYYAGTQPSVSRRYIFGSMTMRMIPYSVMLYPFSNGRCELMIVLWLAVFEMHSRYNCLSMIIMQNTPSIFQRFYVPAQGSIQNEYMHYIMLSDLPDANLVPPIY